MDDRYHARREAETLQEPVDMARKLATKLGLDPYPVNYWIVDHDEMNQLIAYDGFQNRYPHWRWGMKYDRQQKQDRYGGGKAFEIVNNDNPSHAFLQESNTLADQKAVITHVEAHADFFANNEWFSLFLEERSDDETVEAAAMLERHARQIQQIMADPETDRDEVERWIDNVLTLEDTIDQHRPFTRQLGSPDEDVPDIDESVEEQLDQLELSEEVREEVFDEAVFDPDPDGSTATPEEDVLAYLREHGKQFDADAGRADEYEPWQREVIELLRAEAYYFAAQKMSKVMNEGWAAYWESMMMGEETFAGDDEFLSYADHQARVLGSPGLNPYKLGKELWEYVENRTNRREVVERLLRVEGITWRNFEDTIDTDRVLDLLEPPEALTTITPETLDDVAALPDRYLDHEALDRARDGALDLLSYPWQVLSYEGLAHRHYSLVKPQHSGFLAESSQSELERISRYLFDTDRYNSIEAAIDDVEYTAGWDRMYEIRESHNDVTFLDSYLTEEFVDANDYFTYEYAHATGDYRAASVDAEDVKTKLLLQFTNFGKPTIVVEDGNYENRNELLLAHRYNGVMLDIEQAKRVLERVFELWGRPVHLKTIVKQLEDHEVEVAQRRNKEPEPDEQGLLVSYDGEEFAESELGWDAVSHLAADDVDYDTKPDEWL